MFERYLVYLPILVLLLHFIRISPVTRHVHYLFNNIA